MPGDRKSRNLGLCPSLLREVLKLKLIFAEVQKTKNLIFAVGTGLASQLGLCVTLYRRGCPSEIFAVGGDGGQSAIMDYPPASEASRVVY